MSMSLVVRDSQEQYGNFVHQLQNATCTCRPPGQGSYQLTRGKMPVKADVNWWGVNGARRVVICKTERLSYYLGTEHTPHFQRNSQAVPVISFPAMFFFSLSFSHLQAPMSS